MAIIIDNDEKLDFETNSSGKKVFNFFLFSILNILPSSSQKLIRKTHRSVDEVIEHATSHRALELLYQKGRAQHTKSFFDRLAHWVWFNIDNSKGVRNRIKIVKREIINAIAGLITTRKELAILSIASGSARAIIESVHALRNRLTGVKLTIFFLDKDELALEYSKRLLHAHNILDGKNCSLNFIRETASSYLSKCSDDNFDIIEMVGLLDYFDDEKALRIFGEIRRVLSDGGIFVTANIDDNKERKFITRVVGWNMVYRPGIALMSLLKEAGFKDEAVNVFYEPLGLHAVAVAKK